MALTVHKVVGSLPSPLEPDAVYAVRVGEGFDLYISDATGAIAHRINSPIQVVSFATDAEAEAYHTANPTHIVFSTEGA